ncbi:AI-2E family transporter [Oxalobacteraceae bacterium R-40]|uniref:AI-2E family transporter n=1 Tax=Keguizhuia sedimenti TaxID=3064264 RepID=A0ABU1BMY7_9BURK|nr:AI-2E family transporter [Oxalobacteraceae bacterium R-40]
MNIPFEKMQASVELASADHVSKQEAAEATIATTPSAIQIIDLRVNACGIALGILATVALVSALQLAQNFFIPLIFSILVSYTLNPLVVWMGHIKIPRVFATTIVMLAMACGAAVMVGALHDEFQTILTRLPEAAQKISKAISKAQDGQPSTMQKLQTAATEIENAAKQESTNRLSPRPAGSPAVSGPTFKIQDWLWAGSMGAAGVIGQLTMIGFLIFLLLLSGDSFKRKLVKTVGPSLSSKKVTVHILDAINTSIQNYMFMLLVTNVLLAVLLWVLFRWMGLENAGAWAVAAGCLHIIPYFGQLLIAIAVGLAAFLQFGSLSKMLLASGASLLVAVLVGTFLTTWVTGKIAKMNATAVFIGLLFFGWLWGVWGLLLGMPIIVMVRVVAEHIDGLQSVAELLGE